MPPASPARLPLQLTLLMQENAALKQREAALMSAIGSLAGSVSAATQAVLASSSTGPIGQAAATAPAAVAAADGGAGQAPAAAANSSSLARPGSPSDHPAAACLARFCSSITDGKSFLKRMQQRELAVQVRREWEVMAREGLCMVQFLTSQATINAAAAVAQPLSARDSEGLCQLGLTSGHRLLSVHAKMSPASQPGCVSCQTCMQDVLQHLQHTRLWHSRVLASTAWPAGVGECWVCLVCALSALLFAAGGCSYDAPVDRPPCLLGTAACHCFSHCPMHQSSAAHVTHHHTFTLSCTHTHAHTPARTPSSNTSPPPLATTTQRVMQQLGGTDYEDLYSSWLLRRAFANADRAASYLSLSTSERVQNVLSTVQRLGLLVGKYDLPHHPVTSMGTPREQLDRLVDDLNERTLAFCL